MRANLAWFEAMLFAGREFSPSEQREGWPPALRPMQLAALQSPYGGDTDEEGLPFNRVMFKAIVAACKLGAIEHTQQPHESLEDRGFGRRKTGPIGFETFVRMMGNELTDNIRIAPQPFLAWLAEQGEPPSAHILAWATANGIAAPVVPAAAPVQLGIVPPVETAIARQDRRFKACLAAGLVFPETFTNRLPNGVGKLAESVEGIRRQGFSKDVKAGWERWIRARAEAARKHT